MYAGSAYLAVCGMYLRRHDHAAAMVEFTKDVRQSIVGFAAEVRLSTYLQLSGFRGRKRADDGFLAHSTDTTLTSASASTLAR